MANLDRLNAALDAISEGLAAISTKIDALKSGNDSGLAAAADKAEAIKAQLDELDAAVDRAGETPPTTETPAEPPTDTGTDEPQVNPLARGR